tara:strand:+ start:6806 stop:7477 length:672 start_codon:yes stop_codon:yes gene_type:complete
MADRATQIVNFYETTLTSLLASAGTSCTVAAAPTTNGSTVITASNGDENTWFYLVVDPDNSGTREVIVVKTSSSTTFSLLGRDIENRYSGSPPDHQANTTVRMAVLQQHIGDQNDRVATNIASLSTAITNFNTNSAAAITTHNTNSTSAINTFNTNGTAAISGITGSSANAMMAGAANGAGMTIDNSTDYILLYDNNTTTAKRVTLSQLNVGASIGLVLALGS